MKSKKKLAALIGLVVGITLFVAPIASAHHPEISVSMNCDGVVSYTVTAWASGGTTDRTFTGVKVYSGSTLVGTGNFNADNSYSFSGTFTVDSSVTSVTVTATTDGTWGDGYTGVDSRSDTATRPTDCKKNPSISTQASGPVAVGGTIHDVATLSGAANATGAVTFQVFAPGDTSCATPLATLQTSSKNVDSNGNGTYTSADYTTSAVGTYLWRAFFAGDSKNTAVSGACGAENESSTVNKTNPSISTQATGPVTIGGKIHDVATLSGAVGATGAVTFQVFAPGDTTCATPLATLQTKSSNVDSNGNGTYTSDDYTTSATGAYLWRAFFAGDGKNSAVSGACGADNESSTVNKANPSISTQATGPVTIGGKIHDVATLSGAVGATGAVTFQVFAPGDSNCATPLTTLATSSKSVDADGNGTYTSADFTTSAVGTYHWRAFFAGDGKNSAVSGACNAQNESSTVNKTSPSISTTLSSGSVLTGSSVHDSAGLSGATSDAGGTVTYTVFSNANCTASPQDAGTKPVTNGNVPDSNSITFNSAGTYYWQADYSGDAKNSGASSPCTAEVLTVNAPQPHPAIAITKNPKGQTVKAGSSATFSITVTNIGDVTLTNVTVTDPLSPDCAKTSAAIPGLASMAPGASVTYSCTQPNVTEAYTNVATATGTPPSGPNVTATDSAPVTVTSNPAIAIVKDPKSQSIKYGATAKFTITVTNTGDVTLTNVTVTDPLSPDCNRDLGTMTAGQSKSYTCTRGNVKANYRNVATATGKPPAGANVSANDHADVTVAAPFTPPPAQHPKIVIVKSPKSQTVITHVKHERTTAGATQTTIEFGTAHFTITVKNTGDVTLHDVTVSDPRSPNCDKQLGTLAPGASRTYECTRAQVSSDFTNVAAVTGISPKGKTVKDSDRAAVNVEVRTTTSGSGQKGAKHETAPPPKTPKTPPPASIGTTTKSPSFTG